MLCVYVRTMMMMLLLLVLLLLFLFLVSDYNYVCFPFTNGMRMVIVFQQMNKKKKKIYRNIYRKQKQKFSLPADRIGTREANRVWPQYTHTKVTSIQAHRACLAVWNFRDYRCLPHITQRLVYMDICYSSLFLVHFFPFYLSISNECFALFVHDNDFCLNISLVNDLTFLFFSRLHSFSVNHIWFMTLLHSLSFRWMLSKWIHFINRSDSKFHTFHLIIEI